MKKLLRNRKGSALVEYSLVIAGVALVAAAAVSTFGHKVNDMVSATAVVLPGAHADDNGPIVSGKLIETQRRAGDNGIIVDTAGAAGATPRLGDNIFGSAFNQTGTDNNQLGTLVLEAN